MTKSHNPLARVLLTLAVLLSLLTTSCERKELWLPNKQVNIEFALYDINLDLYFGLDWQYEWQYDWSEEKYGPIGYTAPNSYRATIYTLDGKNGTRRSPFTRNMTYGGINRVSLIAANWYDMLFYNTNTEYIVSAPDDEYNYFNMTTRANNSVSYLPKRNSKQITADTTKVYTNYNQPDELFGVFLRDIYVSEDPDDYEVTTDEEGKTIYLYHVTATMEPYSFIYLIQPIIINNYCDTNDPEKPDSTARVRTINGITITGLAQGVELYSRKDWTNTISISTEDVKPMQVHRELRLPDGTVDKDADICASRILTWGLPGIDPMEARHTLNETGVAPDLQEGSSLGLNLIFRKGKAYRMRIDISDLMANHPSGGVITVVIDASKFDREDIDKPENVVTGGGFSASVDDWANEVSSQIVI